MKKFVLNKLRAAVSLLTVFAILLSMTFTGRVAALAASTDILGGAAGSDPLQITVNADGSLALYFWQGSSYVRQYYNETAWGTNVFFTSGGNSLHYSSPYYGATPLGTGAQSRSGNTITTTWSLSGGMNLEQNVTYIPGQSYYEKKWTLTNASSSSMTNLKLFHGGDTYFGGEDAAYSYYNPQTKMVYVKNRDMTRFGLMGFSGSPTSPADRYFSGQYGTGRTEALNGSLDNTANNSFQDAGYQLEWDHATLAAGASWTIDSYERITPPSVVQVLSPAEQTTSPGGTVTYEFVLQNFESATNTYDLTATSQNGWETSMKESSPVTVDGNGATKVVHVSVKTPSNASNGASDSVTLKAVKCTDPSVLSSASTTTHIDATLPSITSVTPSSNTFTPGSTLNVTVGTANVAPGTAVSVQLLDSSKNPLSPPVTGSGTTDAAGQSVVALNIPGNLPAGATYALSVSVTGVAAVQDATTVQTSTYSRPSILCFYAGTSNPYVSGTPTNRDITFSSTESSLQYSTNNGTSWQTFSSPLSSSSGAHYLFRQAGDGNQDDYVSINANIAKSFASTVGGVSNNGQYSTAVTPTFTGATAVLSKDGGDPAEIFSGTSITQSGIYTLTLTDTYGNTQTESFIIDTTAAAISVTGNPSSWVNTDVKLNLLATAGISGIAGLTVSKDNGAAVDITGQETYTVTDNGSYVFTVTNGLGATASQTVNVTKIDKTEPTLSVSGNPSGWVNTDAKLDLSTVAGVSGITGLTVSKDGGIAADITGQSHYTVTDNGSYVFTLTNGVGTAVSQTVKVTKIDKTEPTLSVSGNPSGWVNTDVKLNLSAAAGVSGIARLTVSKDGGTAADITGQDTYTAAENGSYVFTATNGFGTSVSQTVDVAKIDKTVPSLSVSGNPSGWANTDVKLDLSATAGISGIASLTVSKDGGEAADITGQNFYTATDNGSYVFTVTNGYGTSVSQTVTVIKIDKAVPSLSVSGNPSGWANTDVKLDILAAAGRSGIASLTVSKDGGTATDITGQNTYTVTDNGNYTFTVTNGFGTSVSQTVDVTKIDKTVPSLSITGNPSGWGKTDINLGISSSAGLSGITSLTVVKDGGAPTDLMGQTAYTISQYGTYVFTLVNGAGVTETQTVTVGKIDKSAPGDLTIHFKNNVFKSFLNFLTFNLFYQDNVDVTLTAEDNQSGIDHFEYQLVPSSADYNPNGAWTSGSQFTISPQFKGSIYARVYDKLGNVSTAVSSDGFTTTTISPTVAGAENGGNYSIGRVVNYSDPVGEIGSAVYSRDGGASVPFDSGMLFSAPGSYTVTVTDKSGNTSTFSFTVHALPAVSDVLYTQAYKNTLNKIAAEYQSHHDLPQAYGAGTGKAISNLLAQYAKLDAQVTDHQNAIKNITAKINELPSDKSGLIALLGTIQNEFDAVSGDSSTLTAEQKLVLKSDADYLNKQLNVIRSLQAQVEEVKSQISALPQVTAVTKNDTDKIAGASRSFDQLNKEQKGLVGTELTDKLNAVIVKLRTLMLYDKQTDCTVTGIDGTSFDPSVYLSVKQVSETTSGPKFGFAASAVDKASGTKPELQGKEVVALYNISMFQGNTVIEPNGKVQVRIKIPEKLRNRVNLDMVRINDDGSVVPLNATVQGDYLVFVTDHFSTYAMVAKNTCIFGICRFFGIYEADGGICYDWAFIAGAAALLAAAASIVVLKKRKRKKGEDASVPS